MSKKGGKGATGMATFKVGKDHGRVKVFVRIRPFNSDEVTKKENSAVTAVVEDAKIEICDSKYGSDKTYTFDHVFPQTSTNAEVSRAISKSIIKSAMNGFNGTLMAYGQTGAGKTYTLMGPDGITDTVVNTCFARINEDQTHHFKVTMSYLQIYQEKIYDLLNSNNKVELILREHPQKGIYVENLSEFVVRNPSEVMNMLSFGRKRLVFAETKMNRHSSRSHSVCVLGMERTSMLENKKDTDKSFTTKTGSHSTSSLASKDSLNTSNKTLKGSSKTSSKEINPAHSTARDASNSTIPLGEMEDEDELGISQVSAFGDDVKLRGRIYICDLAGSERLKKTNAEGDRLSEAQHINMSLLELGNVIQALAEDRKSHIPFRNSTLTRLLQESLGGNCKTSLIVCVSPAACHVSETKCTLNFGFRAMKVTNNAYVNLEVDYKKLSDELAKILNRRERDMELVKDENKKKIELVQQEYEMKIQQLMEERNKALDQVREYTEKKEKKLLDEIDEMKMSLLAEQEERRRLEREFMYIREDVEIEIKAQLQAQLNNIFRHEELVLTPSVEPVQTLEENVQENFQENFDEKFDEEFDEKFKYEIPLDAEQLEIVKPAEVFNQIPDLVKSVFVSEILSRQLFIAVEKFASRLSGAMKDNLTVEKWLARISDMKNDIQDGAFLLLNNLGNYLGIPVEYWIGDTEETTNTTQNDESENLDVDSTCNITDDEKVKMFGRNVVLSEEAKLKQFQDMSQEELNFALRRAKYSIDREAVSLLRCIMGHHDVKGVYNKEEEFDGLLDKLVLSMDSEYKYLDGSLKEFKDPKHFHESLCYLLIDKSLQSCIIVIEQALKDIRRQEIQVWYPPSLVEQSNKLPTEQPVETAVNSPPVKTKTKSSRKRNSVKVEVSGASGTDDDTVSVSSNGSCDKDSLSERVNSPDSGIISPDTRTYHLDEGWDSQIRKYGDHGRSSEETRKGVQDVISNVNELDKHYAIIKQDQDKLGELLSQLKERLMGVGEMCSKTSQSTDKDAKKNGKASTSVTPLKRTPTISERILQGRQQEKDLRQVHTETKIMEEHIQEIENYQISISSVLAESNDTVEKLKLEKMMKKDESMELRREILGLKRERFQLEMEQDKLDDENEILKEIEKIVHELLHVEDDITALKSNVKEQSKLDSIKIKKAELRCVKSEPVLNTQEGKRMQIGKLNDFFFTAGFCGV